jgi:hypothetical protein
MNISLSNSREWLPFAFIIVGGVLALIAPFLKSGKHRSNKTMQLLATFRASLHEHDIEHWKEIYHGTREAASAPVGHFISRLGKPVPLVSMWTAGSDDHTAIQRMAESLETVCAEMLAHTVDIKMIWSEIGQLMEAMHDWLEDIPGVQQDSTFLEEQYPSLKQVFEKYGNRFKKWPYRVYAKR